MMPTPNLERYARQGVILNRSYVQPVCSPYVFSYIKFYSTMFEVITSTIEVQRAVRKSHFALFEIQHLKNLIIELQICREILHKLVNYIIVLRKKLTFQVTLVQC